MSSIFDILLNRTRTTAKQLDHDLKSRLDKLSSQNEFLKSRLDDLESQLEDKASYDQVSDLDDRLESISSTVSDSEIEVSDLTSKIEDLECQSLDSQPAIDSSNSIDRILNIESRLVKLESFALITESSLHAMFTSNPIAYELGIAFLKNSMANGAPLAHSPLLVLEELKGTWLKENENTEIETNVKVIVID